MSRHAFSYRAGGLSFAWEGGPYIEIYANGHSVAFQVINVWDYGTDEPRIRRTGRAFEAEVKRWLSEQWTTDRMSYEEQVIRYQTD